MTVNEAYEIFKKEIPKKPQKCVEYKTCFVFHIGDDEALDFLVAVDKNTGKSHPFIPMMLSPEEYNKPLNVYKINQ